MPTASVTLTPLGSLAGAPPPSPTLYSALCWATAVLFGEAQAQAMAHELTCTDAFPLAWSGDGQAVRFFPMPALTQRVPELPDRSLGSKQRATLRLNLHKRLKGARYLSEGLFRQAAQGQLSPDSLASALQEERIVLRGACLMSAQEAPLLGMHRPARALLTSVDTTHNELDRWTLAVVEGRLFQREETFFASQAGLWFALHLPSDERMRLLPALLRYLEDTGIGGERTTGKGQFRFRLDEPPVELPHAPDADAWLNLSHYLPTADEVQAWQKSSSEPVYRLVHWQARYEAMFAGGEAVYKPLRRMLAPGSTFPLTGRREVYGRAVPSGERLGHRVWVCGRALPVFIRKGGEA